MTRASSHHAASSINANGASVAPGGAGEALLPKPCHTCARQITPRAKFKANFASVKYCATSCRDQRPGRVVRWVEQTASAQPQPQPDGTLGRLIRVRAGPEGEKETQEGTGREVDLERWVDECLVEVAREAGGKAPLPTCEDVEARLEEQIKSLIDGGGGGSSGGGAPSDHPLLKALHAPPGLRERVRRAARRQVIFPELTEGRDGKLLLYTKGRTTPLVSLEDVSFAKGPISLKWEGEASRNNT